MMAMATGTVTRRNFVAGATLGAAGIAAGMMATRPEAQAAEAAGSAQGEAAEGEKKTAAVSTVEAGDATYGAILNPQAEPHTATTDYAAIFQPLTLAGHTMKNRIAKSAAGSETQHSSDWPSDTSLAYYEQFAKGGAGMICFESSNVFSGATVTGMITGTSDAMPADSGATDGADAAADAGGSAMTSLNINDDSCIDAHKAIADDMHQYGTLVLGQMLDMMMMTGASSSHTPSSDLETCFANGHMQTTEEVQAEIAQFVDAGERYYKAGFDGVELNASCNHYFSTYLSRFVNNERTDQYSGESIENRCRVLTEIIQGIRERVGDDFIIQVLYSGVEGSVDDLGANEGFTTVSEACEMAKCFEAAGATCLHIRSEAYGHHCAGFMPDVLHIHEHGETGYGSVIDYDKHFCGKIDGSHDGYGALIGVAAQIKQAVSIPVGVVGSMDARMAPDLINDAIADGKIDFILATRSLMADPELPNKLEAGRRDECAPCAHCMTCFVAPFDFGVPMYCRVNPAITRALTDEMPEGYEPEPAAEAKKVTVIGGGPAGMEAARIAAQRGHEVTLYEKSDELGGLMDLVQAVKGTHEKVTAQKEWLERELEVYGVTVKTGVEVTADDVAAEAPDAVVVAVGATPAVPEAEGLEAAGAVDMASLDPEALTAGGEGLGRRVVILGAQFQACDLAVYLLKRGVSVTMLNPGDESDLYLGAPTWPRMMGKRWLGFKGLDVYHNVSGVSAQNGSVTFSTPYGTTETVGFDTLVVAEAPQKNRDLYDALVAADAAPEIMAVGDCYAPGTIANATARANVAGRWIGRDGNPLLAGGATELAEGDVYTATATGIGDVTVSISVKDGAIADAAVDTSNETAGVGRDLGDGFADEIREKGAVDAVSGATVTSTAVETALADCLAQAGLA